MEEVLDLYEQPAHSEAVRLCFDERPCQLLDQVYTPLPLAPGQAQRTDYEYKRGGTACVLLAYDLDTGQRYVQVRQQRTKADYAAFFDWLLSTHYPLAARIELVQDNLNTHAYRSFYEHLPVERASQLRQTLRFHFTPKHASWLNMAEIEFSALARQCLNRRIADLTTLQTQTLAWAAERNRHAVKIHWSFTATQARSKLASWYHKVNPNNPQPSTN
jgi:hypothetical protein